MRLTHQRKAILRSLVEHEIVSTRHFYSLLRAEGANSDQRIESHERRVRYLLNRLYTTGLIARAKAVDFESNPLDGLPHWEFAYWLRSRGLAVARDEGLDPDEVGSSNDERSWRQLDHDLKATRFRLALNNALGEAVWWRHSRLKDEFKNGWDLCRVNPDGLFYVGGYYNFLEWENSKQGNYRPTPESGPKGSRRTKSELLRKFANYVAYSDRGTKPYKAKWPDMEGFFVRVVVKNETRKTNLLKTLAEQYRFDLFWVATETACLSDPVGKIWTSPTGSQRSLVA